MSISTFASWASKLNVPYQRVPISQTGSRTSNLAGRPGSGFTDRGGAIPSTAAVPDNTTPGGFGQFDSSGVQRLARFIIDAKFLSNVAGTLIVCDRLSHQGGLSATTTGAQTTNLPTAALTRSTSGVGVWPALEVYTAVGTTATTATMSYTNSAGTAAHTTQAAVFGGAGFNGISTLILGGFQSGDVGCKSVESVTLAASTVSAAGNFGVTLLKPLAFIPSAFFCSNFLDVDAILGFGQPSVIPTDACLQWIFTFGSNTNGYMPGTMILLED